MYEELIKLLVEFFGEGNVEILNDNRLNKTVPDMLSDDSKYRLKAEYQQLLIRFQNLCRYIKSAEQGKEKCTCDLGLLKEQRTCMLNYLNILLKRSVQEGFDLL